MQVIAVFLQVRLPLLEQVFLDFSHRPIVIVSESVGPFEDFAALNDCLTAMLQELELLRRIIFDPMQHLYFILNDWQKFDAQLLRSVMVRESLIVPHVALELGLGSLSLALFVCESCIRFLPFIEIALVVATGG